MKWYQKINKVIYALIIIYNLDLFYETDQINICSNCSNHNEHKIKDNEYISFEELNNIQENLMLKNKEFEKNCEPSFKELKEKINEKIEELKEMKKKWKNAFDDEKLKKSMFWNYKCHYIKLEIYIWKKNNKIILLNQLKKFEFDNNNNMSKKNIFITNIKI